MSDISYLFSAGTIGPTVGHEIILYGPTHILSKIVSTRNRGGVHKQAEAGPAAAATMMKDYLVSF